MDNFPIVVAQTFFTFTLCSEILRLRKGLKNAKPEAKYLFNLSQKKQNIRLDALFIKGRELIITDHEE